MYKMMRGEQTVNADECKCVVYASDEKFVPMLAVSMLSLACSNPEMVSFRLHWLCKRTVVAPDCHLLRLLKFS